ncbi:hypothetical protein VNI00_001641 [Paramarasmius palmivorus]|uniref:WD40 repeat-like protein n=1 Tax=Paramarasmius palmivorus TaxID=297713 RepID=A0AAW0E4N9_9AGAR
MAEITEAETVPWYRNHSSSSPFKLYRKLSLPVASRSRQQTSPDQFRSLAAFPWTRDSSRNLWNDRQIILNDDEWQKMVDKYSDAILVGSNRRIYVFWLHSARQPLFVNLPPHPEPSKRVVPTDKPHVNWVLSPDNPYSPYVVFSSRSLLYIYSFETDQVSVFRGHGGHITSIAVHPILPHLFATTSRDFSTRIYDLTQKPKQSPNNLAWPPRTTPSFSGPAHGLDMNEREGVGIGRCVLVLMGGRAGGHNGDVLNAAFHKNYPMIATCGMDRTVKIWHIPVIIPDGRLMSEDKPLFTSSRIHAARVLSIDWLSDEILISHNAPPLVPIPDTVNRNERQDDGEYEPLQYGVSEGKMIVWRWLGLDRFFPPGWDEYEVRQDVLRGTASDYQESSSYTIISTVDLPLRKTQYETPSLDVFCEQGQDPLVLYTFPGSEEIRVLNIADFKPQKVPPCPWPQEEETILDTLTLSEDGELPGWNISIPREHNAHQERLDVCVMYRGGRTIVATSARSIWIWKAS